MVSSKDVINIINSTWSHSDFGKVSGPYTSIGIFGFVLRILWRVDPIMDISISVFPFLVIILFEMVIGRVNGGESNKFG